MAKLPEHVRQPGILLTPQFEPVTPTIVFTHDLRMFELFTRKCGIPASRKFGPRIIFAGERASSTIRPGYLTKEFEHVAFVGIDPRSYDPYMTDMNSTWFDLEALRVSGQITKAFCYLEPYMVIPNIQDGGREWIT